MLKPEVAKERLRAWIVDESGDEYSLPEGTRFAKSIGKLPSKLAAISFGLRGLDANGEKPSDQAARLQTQDRELTAAKEFDRLSSKDRVKLLQVTFPRMAVEVERTWLALQNAPYQFGWQTKAFRAPQHPDLSLRRRQRWLAELFKYGAQIGRASCRERV